MLNYHHQSPMLHALSPQKPMINYHHRNLMLHCHHRNLTLHSHHRNLTLHRNQMPPTHQDSVYTPQPLLRAEVTKQCL